MSLDWNPSQYHRFQNERQRPFFDLLALVQKTPGGRAVDLGCGSGELTKILHETIGARETIGVDNSKAMLEACAKLDVKGLRFEAGDIASEPRRGPFDLVFSNAALHWLGDQREVLARLTKLLAPNGQLAIQVPSNFDYPAATVAAKVAREAPFAVALGGHQRNDPVMKPEAYAAALHALGYVDQSVRLQVYGHVLADRSGVIEWVKGTLLLDYQKRMPSELWPAFLDRYRDALFEELADERPFFYPFKRLLFWARRPSA